MRRICATAAALAAAAFLVAPGTSGAEGPDTIQDLPGCASAQLPRGDDVSSGPVPIGFALDYSNPAAGQASMFDSLYVNNNASVSFGTPWPRFTMRRLPNLIAPFFSDVDTTAAGMVTYGQTTVGGEKAFCVIWNGVGHYDAQSDHPNTFQLLLIDRPDAGPGRFEIDFNYESIQWQGPSSKESDNAWFGYTDQRQTFSYLEFGWLVGGLKGYLQSLGNHVRLPFFCGGCAPLPTGPRPLIVVPGTLGTFLKNPAGEVWPNMGQMTLPLGDDSYLDALQLGDTGLPSPDGAHQISVETDHGYGGVIDNATGSVPGSSFVLQAEYSETKAALEALGYHYDATPTKQTTLFFFPYDWRLSSAYNGGKLRDFVAEVRQLTGQKPDIIAHSQGGLVTTSALQQGAAADVHRVVTLGTPYMGTPKFLDILEYGKPCEIRPHGVCILNPAEVQKLVRNFLGSNELLPARSYYSTISTWPIQMVNDTGSHALDFNAAYAKLAADGHANPLMLAQATATHDGSWDGSWNALGVPVLRIAGTKLPTPKRAVDATKTVWKQVTLGVWKPFTVHTVTLKDGSGDGTVVYPSAELVNCERGINRNDASANSFGAFKSGDDHNKLVHDPTVLAAAVTFLTSDAMTRPTEACPGTIVGAHIASRSTTNEQTSGLDATTVTATGPLATQIADANGNEIGDAPDGTALPGDEIPGASYNAGVGTSTSSLTGDGVYTGSWTATDDGEAQLEVQVQENEQPTGTTVSPTVEVKQGAVLHLTVSRPGPLDGLQLQVDDNGDGTIDRTLAFYPAVAGAAGDDTTPPTSIVDVQRYAAPDGTPMAHVTVTASDDGGAGVAAVRYQLNAAGPDGVYTGPLDLPAKGEIVVTAIDGAGNVQSKPTFGVLDDHPSLPFLVTDFQPPHLNDTGYLDYKNDVDYWGVDAAAGRLHAQLIGLQANYDLALTDTDGNVLASSNNSGTRSEKIDFTVPAGGHYLLRVGSPDGSWDDGTPYRINVNQLGG